MTKQVEELKSTLNIEKSNHQHSIHELNIQLDESKQSLTKIPILEKTVETLKKQLELSTLESEKEFPMDEKNLTELHILRGSETDITGPVTAVSTGTSNSNTLLIDMDNTDMSPSVNDTSKLSEKIKSLHDELNKNREKLNSLGAEIQTKELEKNNFKNQFESLQVQFQEKTNEVSYCL